MNAWAPAFLRWFAGPGRRAAPGYLLPRWLFLRALGIIYFSAFYSLVFQIRGLIGPQGLLPAGMYLEDVDKAVGAARYWFAPTLLWLGSGPRALELLCWGGMAASLLLILNLWPRGMLVVCFVAFLSFVAAAQDFSGYQSDGMLLSAGFISFFYAPRGFRPRWGEKQPPSRASRFLLQLLWFTIYFESGVAKIMGGDPEWRHLTAMDEYYQNGPLPTWIGWYVQQLPHWFHASTAFLTLLVELVVVSMMFLPRRFRILCFFILTPFEIGIILTANYTFLNYLVLALGVLLLDDRFLLKFLPQHRALPVRRNLEQPSASGQPKTDLVALDLKSGSGEPAPPIVGSARNEQSATDGQTASWFSSAQKLIGAITLWLSGILLAWVFYAMTFLLFQQIFRTLPLPAAPVTALEPFRIANQYGLFGRMTRFRYEIEFQGSNDGTTWLPYPFRYKPQDPRQAPRIYAPYQPRFDWNLWFAMLGEWRQNPFVLHAEQLLLQNDPDVLALFAANPFPQSPPRQVRAVIWQYWFTDLKTKRTQGLWWRRELLGLYAPSLGRQPDGKIFVVDWPRNFIPPP